MILSDRDIKKHIEDKKIIISPKPDFDSQLGACSLDFRLGNEFRVFEHTTTPHIDIKKGLSQELTRVITVKKDQPFIMQPGELVLGVTKERFELPDDLAARLEGRSSLGRIGIIVHATASLFPPGWKGHAVLELSNISRLPVVLYPDMRICAFSFEQLSSKAEVPYYKNKSSKYVNQEGAVSSKIDKDKTL